MPDENGNGVPFLIHFGENTIRGLSVRVHDADKANLSSTSPLSTLDQDFTIEFPFLGKGQSVWNRQAVVPLGGDNRNFNIFFNSANSGWIQEKHMRRVDGKWIGANRVRLDHPSRKILYQCVDSDFPIRSLGDSDSWRTMIGCVEKSR